MPFYKTNKSDVSSIGLHDREYDVDNGFVEVPDEDLTDQLHNTLTKLLGFTVANDDEINAAVMGSDAAVAEKQVAEKRAEILEKFKSANIKVDGRKGLSWLMERLEDAVSQGLIPGEELKEPPAEQPTVEVADPAPKADQNETPASVE